MYPYVRVFLVCEQRLKDATELIEKDDEARDMLHLQKPTLMDFTEINLKQMLMEREAAIILHNLGIGDDPGEIRPTGIKATKRPWVMTDVCYSSLFSTFCL